MLNKDILHLVLDSFKQQQMLPVEEGVAFVYVLRSWKKLSETGQIRNQSQTFEAFYNSEMTTSMMMALFERLAEKHKLFGYFLSHYSVVNKLKNSSLPSYFRFSRSTKKFPDVCDVFCSGLTSKGQDIIVSPQIAQMGALLLGTNNPQTYVPYCNGVAAIPYLDGKVLAESISPHSAFLAELIRILEDREIEYVSTDPLVSPAYHKQGAPHQLRQFESVLAFPPFNRRYKLDTRNDLFGRFRLFRGQNLDAAYLDHVLAQSSDKAVILLPVGFTYRTGVEHAYRKYLIDNNWLDTVILLPSNILHRTAVEAVFLVINKHKKDNQVYFVNLNQESYLAKKGRQTIFKKTESLVGLCTERIDLEVAGLSILIDREEIQEQDYLLTVDRYLLSIEAQKVEKELNAFEDITDLSEYTQVRRSQLFKEEEGEEVYELSPSDFPDEGWIVEGGKPKQINIKSSKFNTYKLKPWDVLVSTKGTIGKVGILGDIQTEMIASQAIHIIRINEQYDKKSEAIVLYMFLRSRLGQTLLRQLTSGSVMPQISTKDLGGISVPIPNDSQREEVIGLFDKAQHTQKEIDDLQKDLQQLHENFLGEK